MKEKIIKYLEGQINVSKRLRHEAYDQEEADLYHREIQTYKEILNFVESINE